MCYTEYKHLQKYYFSTNEIKNAETIKNTSTVSISVAQCDIRSLFIVTAYTKSLYLNT